MAKGKKKQEANASTSAVVSAQPAQTVQVKTIETKGLFPVKPKRGPNEKPPGASVRLICNLFMMSIKQNKSIYAITSDVELVQELRNQPDGDQPVRPAKIGNEYRREAVKEAIKVCVSQGGANIAKDARHYIVDRNGSIAYTLFNLFASPKAPAKSRELTVTLKLEAIVEGKLGAQERTFKVKFHDQGIVDLRYLFETKIGVNHEKMEELQRAVNIILRNKMSSLPYMVSTRFNLFPYGTQNQNQVGPGVIINKGFSTSVKLTECGIVLNVANTVGAFHQALELGRLLKDKFHNSFNPSNGLQPFMRQWLKKEILNKQVEATHINYGTQQKPHYRKYRVSDIDGSALDKFTLIDKVSKQQREVTIMQYFQTEYKVQIKYPKLPCVIDKGRKIPLELCRLVDKQRILRKMDPEETAEIIKIAALPPGPHFQQVRKNVEMVKANSSDLTAFGLDFDPKPIELDGRELPPISLLAGKNMSIKPSGGEYQHRGIFFKPASIKRWVIAFLMDNIADREKQKNGTNELFAKRFEHLYCAEARSKGIDIGPMAANNYIPLTDERGLRATLVNYFKHLNKNKIDHCIFILPISCPDYMYRYLQYLETTAQEGRGPNESWTRTSCVKYKNYMQKVINDKFDGKMFISNLLLKYNTKLGGINFVLDSTKVPKEQCPFLADDYLFISVDVCHPAPGDKLSQSVAAAVGMWDLTNDKMSFCTQLKVQKKARPDHSTVEEVGEIGPMFEELIESYRKKKGTYPRKVVVIRDGVSEGQLKIVLQQELGRVKASFTNKYANAKQPMPLMTCLVVQKRHKVRFIRKDPFMVKKRGEMVPDYNIQPGTVVDSVVTHPTDFSFYLAPHKAIQGTSRAAHNYIILDEIKFSQDQAQAMVHALSYLSPRCTKSTSIPTPVNLADLAAEQGKNLVICWNEVNTGKMSEEERLNKLNAYLSRLADQNYKNTLYYI